MLLLDKHRPKDTSEIFGQDIALRELKRCIINKIPGVLTGSSGIGKTISVYAIANELNYEVVESNSSDIRNKEGIEKVIGIASKQRSLFHKGKIILIDEIEGLTGRYDRGGISAIVDVIKKQAENITSQEIDDKKESRGLFLGLLIILIGLVLFVGHMMPFPFMLGRSIVAGAIIALGFYLLSKNI